jgi:hypothetical protein
VSSFCQEKGKTRLKKRYQIEQQRAVEQFRRIAIEQNPNIQLILPLVEILGMLQAVIGEDTHAYRAATVFPNRAP